MKISAIEIKPGMIIEHKNDYWNVLKTQHVKPGKGGAFNQVELKSILKGTKLNERFRSNETIEKAELDEKKFNFLYLDGDSCHFMDNKNFEQIALPKVLKWAKKNIKKPIVVIGGITDKNYKKLINAGANYIAISSFIWDNPKLKPEIAIKKFK